MYCQCIIHVTRLLPVPHADYTENRKHVPYCPLQSLLQAQKYYTNVFHIHMRVYMVLYIIYGERIPIMFLLLRNIQLTEENSLPGIIVTLNCVQARLASVLLA